MCMKRAALGFALIIFLVVGILEVPVSASVARGRCSYVFLKDLKAGQISKDVYNLQKVLNLSSDTAIPDGIGSSGRESTFLSFATKFAVEKLQRKYKVPAAKVATKDSVLTVVDGATRKVLNGICDGS